MAVRDTGRPVTLGVSDEVVVPGALGLGRAVIVIPARGLSRVDDADLDRLVLHEFAHLQRHDDWWQLLEVAIVSVAAWHPAIRWIVRRIDLERESACDDVVVARAGTPRRYAECLLDVASRARAARGRGSVPGLVLGAAGRVSILRRRVERLLDRRRNASLQLAGTPLVVAGLLLLLSATVLVDRGPLVQMVEQEIGRLPVAAPNGAVGPQALMRPETVGLEPVDEVAPGAVTVLGPSPSGAGVSARRQGIAKAVGPERRASVDRPVETGASSASAPNGATTAFVDSEDSVGTLAAAPLDTHALASVLRTPGLERGLVPSGATGDGWSEVGSVGTAIGGGTKQGGVAVAGFFTRAARRVAGADGPS